MIAMHPLINSSLNYIPILHATYNIPQELGTKIIKNKLNVVLNDGSELLMAIRKKKKKKKANRWTFFRLTQIHTLKAVDLELASLL